MLRAEVRLNYLDNSLGLTDQAIVKTVLGYPVSAARPALKHFVPDVYRLSLALGGTLNAVGVANCLLVTERGGWSRSMRAARLSGHRSWALKGLSLWTFVAPGLRRAGWTRPYAGDC